MRGRGTCDSGRAAFALICYAWIGGDGKMRHRFSREERIEGVKRALASDKTPRQLRSGLRRYLRRLQAGRRIRPS
jgi:hypothetical protein